MFFQNKAREANPTILQNFGKPWVPACLIAIWYMGHIYIGDWYTGDIYIYVGDLYEINTVPFAISKHAKLSKSDFILRLGIYQEQ